MPNFRHRRRLIMRRRVVAAAAGPFGLDGTPVTANAGASGSGLVLPGLTTTYAGDVIVIAALSNGFPILQPTGGGLTFAREPGLTPPNGGGTGLDVWYAVAPAALSNAVFTVPTTTSDYTTVVAFAISGAKTSAPFDVNAAIPTAGTSAGTISTTASDTFAFGFSLDINDRSGGTGYTLMSATANSNFLYLAYKLASAPLSGETWNSAGGSVSISTAIVKGP